MNIDILISELIGLLNEFIEENDIELEDTISSTTRLIGSTGILDSMELVTFIVDVEDFIEDNYNRNVELANDRAMSRRTSPFINIESLSKYILELKNE